MTADTTATPSSDEHELAVLAYGSLVGDPGTELEEITSYRLTGLCTPFNVEYARSSSTRKGAPTLVPVDEHGGPVLATAFVIKEGVGVDETRHRLYRRETRQIGSKKRYVHTEQPQDDLIWLPTTDQVAGVRLAVYTSLEANIPPDQRTPGHLADLAIKSVHLAKSGRDGITYLEENVEAGIVTPLSEAYADAILKQTGTTTLAEARLASS